MLCLMLFFLLLPRLVTLIHYNYNSLLKVLQCTSIVDYILMMNPLCASLVFVMISIIITSVRHLLFPSTSYSSKEESNIEIKKIHTITNQLKTYEEKPYASLYQAYYRKHISEYSHENIEESSSNLNMSHYNSSVLKKTIVNDELVVLCGQMYLVQIEQGIVKSDQSYGWRTKFTVYELPLMQNPQQIFLKGRLGYSKITGFGQIKKTISCIKIFSGQFAIDFPFLNRTSKIYTLKDLIISTNENNFTVSIQTISLENHKNPLLHSFNGQCHAYVTLQTPWILEYNCHKQEWFSFNIFSDDIQKNVFSEVYDQDETLRIQYRNSVIRPKYLFIFNSQRKFYPHKKDDWDYRNTTTSQHQYYITYVYEHLNSQRIIDNLLVQITLSLQYQVVQQRVDFKYKPEYSLMSTAILFKEAKQNRKMHTDCKMYTRDIDVKQRRFNFYSLHYEYKKLAKFQQHSLMCVFAFRFNQLIQVIEIRNVLENPHYIQPSLKSNSQSQFLQDEKISNNFFEEQYEDLVDTQQNQFQKKQKTMHRIILEDGSAYVFTKQIQFDEKLIFHPLNLHISNVKQLFFPLPGMLAFTSQVNILNADYQCPLILFSSIKPYLFTYQEKQWHHENRQQDDYKYLVLGHPKNPAAKNFERNFPPDNHQNENLELEEILRVMYQVDQNVMHQIKSLTVVDLPKNRKVNSPFKKYLVAAWGWGIEAYEINWDKFGRRFQLEPDQFNHETFLGVISTEFLISFIELFATVYCMFQPLITNRR